jgi:hypothetical protein
MGDVASIIMAKTRNTKIAKKISLLAILGLLDL